MKKTILLGCAGTGTAFAAASALRRTWRNDVKIIAMDINPRHLVTTSLIADDYIKVSPVSSPAFKDELVNIINKNEVSIYMPLFPEEIILAATLRDLKKLPAFLRLLVPSLEMAVDIIDKWKTFQLLSEVGLPTPQTLLASPKMVVPSNLILKPRFGCGSKGVKILSSGDIVAGDGFILQEICDGTEVTVDAFYNPAKEFIWTVSRERIEIKSGVSTKCRLFRDQDLDLIAFKLARAARLLGSFCFQVMRCGGEWKVIDINPRPGAGTSMCLTTGNDFFSATFALAFEEEYEKYFTDFTEECFVTRQYADFRS